MTHIAYNNSTTVYTYRTHYHTRSSTLLPALTQIIHCTLEKGNPYSTACGAGPTLHHDNTTKQYLCSLECHGYKDTHTKQIKPLLYLLLEKTKVIKN